ncbi:MAG TPA: pyruvate kinase, partial [Candidatus Ozemobacteraceae bacterium]|nr:pyruvate kinase [Candidatus Ozemobacteraceae bacterium]
ALHELLKRLAELAHPSESGAALSVTLDLQGAKVRIGSFPYEHLTAGPVELHFGWEFRDPRVIPVPFACIFEQTAPGDELLLNDGRVRLRIQSQPEAHTLRAECVQPGKLSTSKGLNRPSCPYRLSTVSLRDQESIRIGLEFPFVDFAVSFVTSKSEAAIYRPLTGSRRLIAKIERLPALQALSELDQAYDELWLCRGDLGTEVEPYRLGELQAGFARELKRLRKPCLLAGEVLGSMLYQPVPTRSEMVHLYDALQAGFFGIVLSDETAVGPHALQVVEFLRQFQAAYKLENGEKPNWQEMSAR